MAFENDWFVEFRISDTAFLSIADTSRATIRDVRGEGLTLTWRVANLVRAREVLGGRGVTTSPIKTRWQAQVCYFHDPEGHRIELWSDNT